MNTFFKYSLWVLMIFLNSLIYASNSPEWEIVPSQSEITFTGTQNGAPVTGRFKKFTGQIFVDPVNYKAGKTNKPKKEAGNPAAEVISHPLIGIANMKK